jgi:8-oxo-dGTP diphosphatase
MLAVACAVIFSENLILAVQRGQSQDLPGKWEFPGGKVEPDESEEACLIREIREELGLEIQVGKRLNSVEHDYKKFKIHLIPFVANIVKGEMRLTEHQAYKWLTLDKLDSVDWAPADWPIVNQLQENGWEKS